MSGPHGPNPNLPPAGQNPYGNTHLDGPKPGQIPTSNFGTVLSSDQRNFFGLHRIPDAHDIRERAAQEADQARYAQLGHEAPAKLAKLTVDLAHIALKGESRKTGEQTGTFKRVAAGVGAVLLGATVALPSAAVGLFTTYPTRIVTNIKRGHTNVIRPVVPRRGERPHTVRHGYSNNPYGRP